MLTIYYKGKKTRDLEHRKITDIKTGSWVHVEQPTADELRRLIDEAGLDEGLLSDATDPYEVPRVEKEAGATYAFTRVPYKENGEVVTTPVLVVVAPNFLVTIAQKKLPLWKPFFDTSISFYTTQKTQLFFLIFRQIGKEYQRLLTGITKQVRQTTVRLEKISNKDIIEFVRFERTLNDFTSALNPTRVLLGQIQTGKYFRLYEDDDELIEDLELVNGQLIEACSSNLKAIVNIRSAYSSIMTNKLNQVIKVLTALTIVLTVPTMIASFFGMNVAFPFGTEGVEAFWIIIGVSFVAAVILMWVFMKDKWL